MILALLRGCLISYIVSLDIHILYAFQLVMFSFVDFLFDFRFPIFFLKLSLISISFVLSIFYQISALNVITLSYFIIIIIIRFLVSSPISLLDCTYLVALFSFLLVSYLSYYRDYSSFINLISIHI